MKKQKLNTTAPVEDDMSFIDATGPVRITLRNDMLFHKVMQHSNNALKGLICSLKGLDPSTVKEVSLSNPIDYPEYQGKEIIFDVKVLLNTDEILDVELQLYDYKYWKERSVLYLCRSFDSIDEGEGFELLKPTTFIAIMDKPIFKDQPEFYSKYRLLNEKNHTPYTSLISLNVLYLSQTELATEEDKKNGLVYWAELFKATTWEELKSLCDARPEFKEVVSVMYKSNVVQSTERTIFEAHEKYLMEVRSMYSGGYNAAKEEYEAKLVEANSEIERLKKLLSDAGISSD